MKKIFLGILLFMLLFPTLLFVGCNKNNVDNTDNGTGEQSPSTDVTPTPSTDPSTDEPIILSIALSSNIRTQYLIGEDIDFELAKLVVTYNNKPTEYVDLAENFVTNFKTTSAGNFTMKISYQNKYLDIDYNVQNKDYVSVSAKDLSNRQNVDMPYFIELNKKSIATDGVVFDLKVKENISTAEMEIIKQDCIDTTFTVGGKNYQVDLVNETIEFDGIRYSLVAKQSATKYTLTLANNLNGQIFVTYNNKKIASYQSTSDVNKTIEVYKGESVHLHAFASSGPTEQYAVRKLKYGTHSINYNCKTTGVNVVVKSNLQISIEVEQVVKARLKIQLRSIDIQQTHLYDYKLIGEYRYIPQYTNNSCGISETMSNQTEFELSTQYPNGQYHSYIFSNEIYLNKDSGTTFTFNHSVGGEVFYNGISYGTSSQGGSKDLNIQYGNVSTYSQQIEICTFNGIFKVVYDVTIEILWLLKI